MNNHLWKRILPCLLAGMILLLCGGFALAEPATSDMTAEILNDGATVQRGEFLYVDVCEFVGATDYEVVVVDEDGEAAPDNRSYAFGIAPGEYTVQTATL
ncbi:MAG: hypothetical protein IKO55_06445, partial [Kiritimatiellae bacterium]|nr:hypothetical protein [Kiritimatiellia bacterium]